MGGKADEEKDREQDREISASAARRILGVSPSTLRKYAEDGELGDYRNAAPKASRRPDYRYSLKRVRALLDIQRKRAAGG